MTDKQALIDELEALLNEDIESIKDQVESIKTRFYSSERLAEEEEKFKALLVTYREKKAVITEKLASELKANLARKEAIVAELKKLADAATADVMGDLQKVRDLQAEWKEIGAVPAEKVAQLNKDYSTALEQFYDLVRINFELRDHDLKRNLELKTAIIEKAVALQANKSVIEANRMLQKLHEEWAEVGPVARELREEIWTKFKEASTIINKKHQEYFDALHQKEQENLEKKQALIARLKELVAGTEERTNKEWDALAEKVQALQAEWKTIGFAPRKFNQSIYDEFRAEIDAFFNTRREAVKANREAAKQRHQEYLERQAERERKHAEWEQRQAERAERAKEHAERAKERAAAEAAEAKRIAKMKPTEMWEAIADKWKVTKK